MKYLTLSQKDNVAIITMDRPNEKVNTLNQLLIDEFPPLLDAVENDVTVKAIILISGKSDTFIAGADLEMLKKMETPEQVSEFNRVGNDLLDRIASFKKPIIAAIHGSTMGGGLEVALACHGRVATNHKKTVFALPEVKLGLLPGGGGTQRLPKLIGLQKSLGIMLTGKNIYPRQAKKMGLIDDMIHKDALLEAAMKLALSAAKKGRISREDLRSSPEKALESNPVSRGIIYSQAKATVLKETRGNYPAPLRILECVKTGIERGFKAGREAEVKYFTELVFSKESKALVNLFFGMTNAKKNHWQKDVKPVSTIGVLGAGLMGAGITQVSAEKAKYNVVLKDRDLESVARGLKPMGKDWTKRIKKRIMTTFEKDQIMSRIRPAQDYLGFSNVEMVIEAVFEDLGIKHKVLKESEAVAPDSMIFASNTSSLPISEIAKGAKHPDQVIGMHYFSPVPKMPLLEIIKTDKTADWVIATTYDVGVKQGKTCIVVNDGPGFYTTRILAPFMNEALLLLQEGASVESLDSAMKDWGFPVGPMVLMDEVGIDVAAHITDVLSPLFATRGMESTDVVKKLASADYKGRKNKKGFYKYEDEKSKKKEVNTDIYSFFGGSKRKSISAKEIQDRMAMMMINEALYCLQEDILLSPEDGDLGSILGLGFPPFRGGPFFWIDHVGASFVLHTMRELESKHGIRFKPAPILEDMAENNQLFYSI